MTLVDADTGEIVQTLESCETVIERGLGTFVEVGNALLAIRDAKLYRAGHDTFEAYCKKRWGFSRSRAHRLIEASEVAAVLPIGNTRPTNEAQARELVPLKEHPELAAESMRRATEKSTGKVTSVAVKEAVAEVVREEIAKAEQRAEDRDAIAALSESARKAGLDMDEDRVRQRGEFARLCKDIAKLPDPAEFIGRHGTYLRERHGQYAVDAQAWLNKFVEEWGNR